MLVPQTGGTLSRRAGLGRGLHMDLRTLGSPPQGERRARARADDTDAPRTRVSASDTPAAIGHISTSW